MKAIVLLTLVTLASAAKITYWYTMPTDCTNPDYDGLVQYELLLDTWPTDWYACVSNTCTDSYMWVQCDATAFSVTKYFSLNLFSGSSCAGDVIGQLAYTTATDAGCDPTFECCGGGHYSSNYYTQYLCSDDCDYTHYSYCSDSTCTSCTTSWDYKDRCYSNGFYTGSNYQYFSWQANPCNDASANADGTEEQNWLVIGTYSDDTCDSDLYAFEAVRCNCDETVDTVDGCTAFTYWGDDTSSTGMICMTNDELMGSFGGGWYKETHCATACADFATRIDWTSDVCIQYTVGSTTYEFWDCDSTYVYTGYCWTDSCSHTDTTNCGSASYYAVDTCDSYLNMYVCSASTVAASLALLCVALLALF